MEQYGQRISNLPGRAAETADDLRTRSQTTPEFGLAEAVMVGDRHESNKGRTCTSLSLPLAYEATANYLEWRTIRARLVAI